jgi:hypothetical protein
MFGNEHKVYPRLYSYVVDHPEGCKVIKNSIYIIHLDDLFFSFLFFNPILLLIKYAKF